ncbi:MAG: phosphatase PAP2 family protein [Planctomycetes bacterium]|nr:phosphatase PAP2 family protein [Planctomycetota bacterium]
MNKYCWKGFRRGAVCAVLFFAACCVVPVRSQTPEAPAINPEEVANETDQAESPSKKSLFLESAKTDFLNWPRRIIADSKDTVLEEHNFNALLMVGGISIAMHHSNADKNIAEHFERHSAFHGFADETFNFLGHPGFHFAATGLWYGLSAESQDEFNRERAWTMMTALSVTGLVTVGLKGIRDNDTPNEKSWAWPSGHTSSSFTVASVLDEFYGPKVGIPAYILAGLVGYRMADTGDHWASDVVFGATLGWIVGHTVAGKHKELEVAGFKVLPYTGGANGSAVGVSFMKQF